MTCPKDLRNGPCGGVRLDGTCEVLPDTECIWVKAVHRSEQLPWTEEIHQLRPPVNWSLEKSSSWTNFLTRRDQISSGCFPEPESALDMAAHDGS